MTWDFIILAINSATLNDVSRALSDIFTFFIMLNSAFLFEIKMQSILTCF